MFLSVKSAEVTAEKHSDRRWNSLTAETDLNTKIFQGLLSWIYNYNDVEEEGGAGAEDIQGL